MRKTPKPRQLRDEFETEVLAPIEVAHPRTGEPLSYHDYLSLDPQLRTGDDQPILADAFIRRLLAWLGYRDADWEQDTPGENRRDRPDWTVSPRQAVAFVIETTGSPEEFGADHVEQLRRYTAGTQGYALWTNTSVLLALRFEAGGEGKVLARVPVDTRRSTLTDNSDAGLAVLRILFQKQRFVEMPGLLDRICVSEETWKEQARPLDSPEAQREFSEETRKILDKLTLAARAEIDHAEADVAEARADVERTRSRLNQEAQHLLETVSQLPAQHREPVEDQLQELLHDPMYVDEEKFRQLKPEEMGFHAGQDWDRRVTALLSTSADFRRREVQRLRSRRIHNAFQQWKAHSPSNEDEEISDSRDRNAYAEHVAHTLFIRLLLARALEDRGAIDRLLSDGGLQRWRRFSEPTQIVDAQDPGALHGRALLDILDPTVARFYQDEFNQPFFDWFMPDDYLLALALDRLCAFSFADMGRNILEFAQAEMAPERRSVLGS